MKFPDLPWFIREEVIKQVIEDEPRYCRVNKEWLKLVADKHGLLYIVPELTELDDSNTLFTPHIKKVEFRRTTNINWDLVYSHNNVTEVAIKLNEMITFLPVCVGELLDRCLKLSPLESLDFNLCTPDFDFSSLIKNNQHHLKSLSISTAKRSWQLAMENMKLPNLVQLKLNFVHPAAIQTIIKNMPNLNILSLAFFDIDDSILFKDFELPNLTRLDLKNIYKYVSIKVDLANLPNIKNLSLGGNFELAGEHVFNRIEELQVTQNSKYFLNHIFPRFLGLTTLGFNIPDKPSHSSLWNILRLITTLTRVRLGIKCRDLLENLPPGPYAITHLILHGRFYTTSYLFHWLSSSFKLQALDLHACYLEEGAYHGAPSFNHLKKLRIRVRPNLVSLFTQSYNNKTHPHIDLIEITSCKCTEQKKVFSFIQ